MAERDAGTTQPRDDVFGFTCSRCRHCCNDKRIQVNPYEVARLARSLDISTTEFRARHTKDGRGVSLISRPDGDCEFLGPEGCEVHADRPLVCRLYPLGRHVEADGTERFSRVVPHPKSGGSFHSDGTIASYLAEQGAAHFIHAADAYFDWLCRADECLDQTEAATDAADDSEILDMDLAIGRYCGRTGEVEPSEIEDRRMLHMKILDAYLNSPEGDTA